MKSIFQIVFALGALMTWSSAAMAATIVGATASAHVGGTFFTDSDTGSAAASASVVDLIESEYRGQSGATAAGQLGTTAQFFGASGTFATITAAANWTETFDATASSTATIDFFIPDAAIGFTSNNVPGLIGSYEVAILFNGTSIFDAFGEVELTSNSPDIFSLDQQGTILSATFASDIPIDGATGSGYRFGAFSGSLNLSPVAGVNTLEYSMTTMVAGLIGETGALASIGDPLNLAQQPAGANLTVGGGPSPVPEPNTLVMMLLGGLTMLLVRKCFR
jgi:hypothetical protein